MIDSPLAVSVPLRTDKYGAIRVGGTRVTLDIVIGAYQRGETPEQIVDAIDVLKLVDVYAVIAYYLANRDEIDAYLQKGQEEAEALRRMIEANQPDTSKLRARLRAVLEEKRRSE